MLRELLEGVTKVSLLLNSSVEFVNFSLSSVTNFLLLLGNVLKLSELLNMSFFVLSNIFLDLLLALSGALNLRVVQEPFSKEIYRVLGVSAVHNSHSLSNDETKLG